MYMFEYSEESLKATSNFNDIKAQYMKVMGESWEIVKKECEQVESNQGIKTAIEWLSYHPLDCTWKILHLNALYKKWEHK